MDERRVPPRADSFSVDRRSFLKVSAGSMAAMAVHSAYTLDTLAQEDHPVLTGRQFLTNEQAETIEALAEQFWPTTDDSPGGRDAGVVHYIDNALAGAYQEYKQVYRTGIDWLDDAAQREYGSVFRQLSSEDQTALITAIFDADEDDAVPALATPENIEIEGIPLVDVTPVVIEPEPEGTGRTQVAGLQAPTISTLQEFMSLALNHTMEGLFSDPVYGGNRDFAGWRAVGYPGAHYLYTEEEQQSFEPLNKPIQSLADL